MASESTNGEPKKNFFRRICCICCICCHNDDDSSDFFCDPFGSASNYSVYYTDSNESSNDDYVQPVKENIRVRKNNFPIDDIGNHRIRNCNDVQINKIFE
jgi:hypothetical protein